VVKPELFSPLMEVFEVVTPDDYSPSIVVHEVWAITLLTVVFEVTEVASPGMVVLDVTSSSVVTDVASLGAL